MAQQGKGARVTVQTLLESVAGDWRAVLEDEMGRDYFANLLAFVNAEYDAHAVHPNKEHIFAALAACAFKDVRVVILGQDPYPAPGNAHGLAFSVQLGVKTPGSLRNIYKELEQDPAVNFTAPTHGHLASWAAQGVMLLNTVLTVRSGEANSHKGRGWEVFTDAVIRQISEKREHVVFLLWGRQSQQKADLIDSNKHLVLQAAHPSPLSASKGFFGCRCFSSANEYLAKTGHAQVVWQLPPPSNVGAQAGEVEEFEPKPMPAPKKSSARGGGAGRGRGRGRGRGSKGENPAPSVAQFSEFGSVVQSDQPFGAFADKLKIVSWNVNGLRSTLKGDCPFEAYVRKESADIVCIQETKLQDKDVASLPEIAMAKDLYPHQFFNSSQARKGYAGTAILSKFEPINVVYGIGVGEYDQEGRVITAEFKDFFLVTSYTPNAGQKLERLEYRTTEWDRVFLAYISKLDAHKPVIWTGDLNVAHHEIDIADPEGNRRSAGFTVEERDSFTEMLGDAFVDSFRKLNPNKPHCYSYWSNRGGAKQRNKGWRLDYFIVSARFFGMVEDSYIRGDVDGSDHSPVGLVLKPDVPKE